MRKTTIALVLVVMLTSTMGCGTSRKKSIALLRIKPAAAETAAQKDGFNYEVYCQTQVALIQSPFVLNAALRRLREQGINIPADNTASPLEEIQSRLTTSRPGKGEILRVSYAGRKQSDSVAILDAIIDAYLEEIAAAECSERVQRLSILKSEHQKQSQRLTNILAEIHLLEAALGTSHSMNGQLDKSLLREELAAAARRVENLRDQLISAQIEQQAIQSLGDEATAKQIATDKLAAGRVEAISQQLAVQDEQYQKLVQQRRSESESSADLLAKKAELQVLEQNVQGLAAEISRFELQQQGPGLVSLVQPALIP